MASAKLRLTTPSPVLVLIGDMNRPEDWRTPMVTISSRAAHSTAEKAVGTGEDRFKTQDARYKVQGSRFKVRGMLQSAFRCTGSFLVSLILHLES
jgi:hypothetical protein